MLYRIFGVVFFLVFYGIYFKKMLDQRRAGIVTDQLGKGDKSEDSVRIERLTRVAAVLVAVSGFISVLFSDSKIFSEFRDAGAVCCLVGIGFFYAAVKAMGDSWRAGIPEEETKLVTTGVYKLSRNPAFLGFDLLHIGVLLMFFNFFLLLFTVFAVVMYHLQILNEERHLEEVFGREYLRYKEKTGRYFSA